MLNMIILVIYTCMFKKLLKVIYLFYLLTIMDKNMDKNMDVSVVILERTIEQLTQKLSITSLEREKYRYERSPSFLTGYPFTCLSINNLFN